MASSTQQSTNTQQSTSTQQSSQPTIVIDREVSIRRPAPIDTQQSQSAPIVIDADSHFERHIIVRSRPTTPSMMSPTAISPTSSPSRHSTPALEANIISSSPTRTRHVASIDDERAPPPPQSNIREIEAMLVKQGRQIRTLYELQKSTFEKVSSIDTQVKKLAIKSTDLSPKVFAVSNHNLVLITFHI
jgi:hypothetical protein